MAMDKSKENSRIQDFVAMGLEAQNINIMKGIKNSAILKHYLIDERDSFSVLFKYAMAAGLIDMDDVIWIEEHEEEIISELSENGGEK